MADKIKLVQGDTLPYVNVKLVDSTGGAIDISDPSANVYVLFRAAGSYTTLSTIPCFKTNGGADGFVRFAFSNGVLDVDPGAYEGEVVVDFGGGNTQTVFDLLKFYVRQR